MEKIKRSELSFNIEWKEVGRKRRKKKSSVEDDAFVFNLF